MCDKLASSAPRDVVLLHACAHNPTGVGALAGWAACCLAAWGAPRLLWALLMAWL